jgi:hypothetical protein
MPRGRRKKPTIAPPIIIKPVKQKRAYRSLRDLVSMMERYHTIANGKSRGLFEDCKAEIYRLFVVDYNDRQVDDVRPTGTTDRLYGEWETRFVRAFGAEVRDAA